MQYSQIIRWCGFAAAVAVAGCATQQAETPKAPPPQPVAVQPPAPRPAPPVVVAKPAPRANVSSARTVDAFKHEVASKIAAANSAAIADKLPPILKSVVVVEITVDRDGKTAASLRRSNGHKDLEQAAIAAVRRAGTVQAPSDDILGGQTSITYLETFLFRPDGRYQIRTLASAPAPTGAVAKKN
jgi:protein TonB